METMSNSTSIFQESTIHSIFTTTEGLPEIGPEPCNYGTHASRFLPVLYSLFFMVGFPANMLVLWVILRGAQMKSMTDVSLLNLAIADLLLLFTLPFLAYSAIDTWIFGEVMCTLVLSVYRIGFYAGIFFIVMMSIDRYLAIVHAMFTLRAMYETKASTIIWIIAVLSSFPELMFLGIEENGNETYCIAYPKNYFHSDVRGTAIFRMNILGLLIPLIIVGFCYLVVLLKLRTLRTSKKLAVRLSVIVMLAFFCCWTPYNIAAFVRALELKNILLIGCDDDKRIRLILQITEAMAYSHSCLNPFLYVFLGKKYRRHLAKLLLHTPCIQLQCMKRYLTEVTGSVHSGTTEEHSAAL